ncbi:MAG: hypothetical protein NXI00_03115 [Cytophagales bacterium]|nr:hypothetical protein [Cytophagales bacterium]
MKWRTKYTQLCLMLLVSAAVSGQTTLHILTKTIRKEVPSKLIKELVINSERADIEIEAWEKEDISIEVKLSSKHPDKARAQRELAAMHFLNQKIGKAYYLRNYLLIQNGSEKPESNFAASYKIRVPARLALSINNTFGEVKVNGVKSNLKLKLEFCQSLLTDCQSVINLISYFGSNVVADLMYPLILDTDHSESIIKAHKGSLEAKVANGSLVYDYIPGTQTIKIEAKEANLTVNAEDIRKSTAAIKSSNSNWKIPKNNSSFHWKESEEHKNLWENKGTGQLIINLDSGSLTIQ